MNLLGPEQKRGTKFKWYAVLQPDWGITGYKYLQLKKKQINFKRKCIISSSLSSQFTKNFLKDYIFFLTLRVKIVGFMSQNNCFYGVFERFMHR